MVDLNDLLDLQKAVLRPTAGVREVRNYVDLHVGQVQVEVNHSAGTVEFSVPIKNIGDLPAKGPFSIVMGVSYHIHDGSSDTVPQSYTHEVVYTFNQYDEIPGNSTYVTNPAITTLLGYIDVSAANKYDIEVLVDPAMQVPEPYTSNNRTTVRWFTSTPPAAASRSNSDRALTAPRVAVLSRQTRDGKDVSNDQLARILANAKGTATQ